MVVAIASVAVGAAPSLGTPSRAALAQDAGVRCDEGDSIRVLFLLDTSTSLLTNDPDGTRTSGTIDALNDLSGILDDYQSRLTRHFPGWSVFAAVDTFSGFNTDPARSNPYGRLSGEWKDIALQGNRQQLVQAARDVQRAPGSWTDYREALAGAIERFGEPVPRGVKTCDFLFWFTDGNHDTVAAGVFTAEEQEQIDGMCRSGGLVDRLRQAEVNVTAIELRVDRESSDQLRRLVVGQGSDCAGLNGKIADVASVADLAAQIEETVYRLVDLDFPTEFVDPCDSPGEHCDYSFTLDDDAEWIKVYVDLAGVDDPEGVGIALLETDGQPVAPFRFGEEWSLVADTGMVGRQPTPTISVIWAHQVSYQLYGTEWGDSQTWTIRFSGPEAARARTGIRKDERGRPTVQELEVAGENLTGRIIPAPTVEEEAVVVLHLDDGRQIEIAAEDRMVRDGGRFVVPRIVDLIVDAAQGDDYLATNGCTASVVVSLGKTINYGPFAGAWDSPILDSTAAVSVPRARCGLAGLKTPSPTLVEHDRGDPFDPSGSLRVTADGGLLPGVLGIREVRVEGSDGSAQQGLLGAWAQGWQCEVPADARSHACGEAFVLDVSTPLDAEVDITLVFEARTTDPLEDPPTTEVVSYNVTGVSVAGQLPTVTDTEAIGQFDPSGSLRVTAAGGWQDGILSLDAGSDGVLGISRVDGPRPQLRPEADWRCEVSAGATGHECPPLPIDAAVEDDTVVDVSLPFRAASADPESPTAITQSRTIEALPVRIRESGEVLGSLLRYLGILIVVFVLTRVLVAWVRRRWKPLDRGVYCVATAQRGQGRIVSDEEVRPTVSPALTKAYGSASFGPDARLLVRWWPLLRGGQVEVVALPTAGRSVIASSDPASGRRPAQARMGKIGRSLENGWVALEHDKRDSFTLIFWDVDKDSESARAQELWNKVETVLAQQQAADPQREESSGVEESSVSSDDGRAGTMSSRPSGRRGLRRRPGG